MLPEGCAADIGVKSSNYRVADIHLRGHLIATFTLLEQSKCFSLCVPGHIGWGVIALGEFYSSRRSCDIILKV